MRVIRSSGSVRDGAGDIPVYSAQSVFADAELSGVVGEDDGVAEPILGDDRAP